MKTSRLSARISIEQVDKIDAIWHREVQKMLFLGSRYGEPLPLPLHHGYADSLTIMAAKWDVGWDEFRPWVCLHIWAHSVAHDPIGAVSVEEKAQETGIPVEKLRHWLARKIAGIREALE